MRNRQGYARISIPCRILFSGSITETLRLGHCNFLIEINFSRIVTNYIKLTLIGSCLRLHFAQDPALALLRLN